MNHVGEDILLFEAEFLSALKTKEIEQAKDYFYMITVLEKPKLSKDSLQSLKNYYVRLFTKMEDLLKREFTSSLKLHLLCNTHILAIDNMYDYNEINKYAWKAINDLVNSASSETGIETSNVIQSATNFILHNLTHELTLKSVSEYIGVHPNYLSMLFKKKLNQNFSDYVNYHKVKESISYLLYSNFSITKIALHFGFCNSSYYTYLFKKYFDLTPNQYRKKYRLGELNNDASNGLSDPIHAM